MIILDLDHFKLVNDEHDHLFGSRVLRRMGELLRSGVRDTDMVIRYAGDEFCILLPHTNLANAMELAERLRSRMEHTDLGDNGNALMATISMGVASLADSSVQIPTDLLLAADQALYQAKSDGRNCVVAAPARPQSSVSLEK